MSATGDQAEMQNGAPGGLAAFNAFGNLYHIVFASDLVKLSGDSDLPIFFVDLEPGVPHTIRVEVINDPPPSVFRWYIDSNLIHEGPADGVFPSSDARITWVGRTWQQPTLNEWHYIRTGDIPLSASGDFNSDGEVDQDDHFYFSECIDRGFEGEPAIPSCDWADFNADDVVNCDDAPAFEAAWTGPGSPPTLFQCLEGGIPATSEWGVIAMAVGVLAGATILFRTKAARVAG